MITQCVKRGGGVSEGDQLWRPLTRSLDRLADNVACVGAARADKGQDRARHQVCDAQRVAGQAARVRYTRACPPARGKVVHVKVHPADHGAHSNIAIGQELTPLVLIGRHTTTRVAYHSAWLPVAAEDAAPNPEGTGAVKRAAPPMIKGVASVSQDNTSDCGVESVSR